MFYYGALTFLHLTWGLVTALLVYFFFVRIWIRRGAVFWAWLGGAALAALSFGAGQFSIAYAFYKSFSRYGPCSLCYEWSWMPFTFYRFGWMAGALVFLALTIWATIRFVRGGGEVTFRLPRQAAVGFAALALIAAGLAAFILVPIQAQRRALIQQLQTPLTPITNASLRDLGSTRLPWTFAQAWRGQPPYAALRSLNLSPDKRWLAIEYERAFELWDRALQPALKVEIPYYGYTVRAAFSADTSMLALWNGKKLEAYALKESTPQLLSQVDLGQPIRAFAFTEDGDKLTLVFPNEVQVLEAASGRLIEKRTLPSAGGFIQVAFDRDGRYLARWHGSVIEVFAQNGAELVGQFPAPLKLDSYFAEQPLLFFLADERLLFVHPYGGEESPSIVWNIATGAATPLPFNAAGGSLSALSPDGNLLLLTDYQKNCTLWETANFSQLGSLGSSAAITDMAFSPDQTLLVIATADGQLHFYTGQ